MGTTKMTVRKANADRKLIDSQLGNISKQIACDELMLIGIYQSNKPIINLMTPKEYEEKIKSSWQRINDLLLRREKLNAAVMRVFGGFNNTEEPRVWVEVPKFEGFDKPMSSIQKITIAQAIARKNYFKTPIMDLINRIQAQARRVSDQYDKWCEKADKDFKTQINSQFGPESSQTAKQRIEYADSIRGQYTVNKIDPLNIAHKTEEIRIQVLDYINTIDSILSKATETFEVEIED